MDRSMERISLPDGRVLSYAEWGDLNGKPVFFFGGANNARLIRHPDDSIVQGLGIHLYTFDRPGMGHSTRQPGRRLLNWAEDIRSFAAAKKINRFAVMAASQGGPYGAACAYALPDLLSSVSLVSGVAGLEDARVMATQMRMIRAQIFLARRLPGLLALQFNMMKPMLKGDRARSLVRTLLNNLPESDKQTMSMPGAVDLLVQDIRESMRHGGAGGADDMRAVVLEWGFRLEDIRGKVFIWQGEQDPNVTPAMAHYMAERIPDSELTLVPEMGHFLAYSHWRQILEQIMTRWRV